MLLLLVVNVNISFPGVFFISKIFYFLNSTGRTPKEECKKIYCVLRYIPSRILNLGRTK